MCRMTGPLYLTRTTSNEFRNLTLSRAFTVDTLHRLIRTRRRLYSLRHPAARSSGIQLAALAHFPLRPTSSLRKETAHHNPVADFKYPVECFPYDSSQTNLDPMSPKGTA